jgi:hypothetical protein
MSASVLEKAGIALYGPTTWKHPLARDLGISLRGFRRMTEDQAPIPDGLWADLRGLLLAHSLECRDIAVTLPKGSPRTPDGLPQDFGAGDV